MKIAPKYGLRPLGKLMWWSMGKSKPPYVVALKVEAKGQLGGIHMMRHLAEPVRLINDMQKMGAQIIESLDLFESAI